MLAAIFAALIGALPASVQACVQAVRSDGPQAAAACTPAPGPIDIWSGHGLPSACRAMLERGRTVTNMRRRLADQPVIVAGLLRDFEEKVSACEGAANAAPPANDRQGTQHPLTR